MEKIILTDCDGVLCQWETAFEKYIESEGYPKHVNTNHEYDIAIRHGLSMDKAQHFVRTFNNSSHIGNLAPFADSVEYVTKLASLDFKFIVISSVSDLYSAKAYRTQNLKNLFGDIFNEVICLPMGVSKAKTLSRWKNSKYFWIEDHIKQAEVGHEVGLRSILIDHPYNVNYTTEDFLKINSVTPWKEIYTIVCKEYKINS